MDDEQIAKIAYEANRVYCQTLGDMSQPSWEDAAEWQRTSVINGVRLHRRQPEMGPEDSHKSWMVQLAYEGWVYGPEKRPDLKQHPCMVPFEQLPRDQRMKDYLFNEIVHALLTH